MEKRSDIRRNISIFATEQERNIPPRSERNMEKISLHPIKQDTRLEIPIAVESVHAGFPSPAQDYMEDGIDLNKELVRHPASTFYARVAGNSMKDAGINPGDILVVDKLLEPKEGDIAVCFIDGEYTLKYIRFEKDAIWLDPANENYPSIKITEDNHFIIWGIVTFTIQKKR